MTTKKKGVHTRWTPALAGRGHALRHASAHITKLGFVIKGRFDALEMMMREDQGAEAHAA